MTTQNALEDFRAIGDPRRNEWLEKLARFGIATKGVVYLLMGALAVMAAAGASGGRVTGNEGAVRTLGEQPFGQVLLALVAVGLGGYALWRFAQAAFDPDNDGTGAKGIAKRVGYAAVGAVYVGLAAGAVQTLTGSGGRGDRSQRMWLDALLAGDAGQVAVALLGLVVVGVGLFQFKRAVTADFMRELDTRRMSAAERTWTERLGRLGHAARGVVFPILGWFLVRAATRADSSEWRGSAGALRELARQDHGTALLAVVAAGLAAYGVYEIAESRHRRIGGAHARR